MIRVTVGNDVAYAETPEGALLAARTLNQESTAHGYRAIEFHDDDSGDLIHVTDGAGLYEALHAEARRAAGRAADVASPGAFGTSEEVK